MTQPTRPSGRAGSEDSIGGMRDLLRDTALEVTTLASSGRTADVTALRERCRQLITQFASALEQRGFAADVRQDAALAHCGLLDETALRYLPQAQRDEWEGHPLQVEVFELHDAGERVIDRLQERMRETPPHTDLLELYASILGLGFVGRYAREGAAKRHALVSALASQLEQIRPSTTPLFIVDRPGQSMFTWLRRLSPWAIAGLAFLASIAVWLVLNKLLDAQLAQLLARSSRP